MIFLKIKLLLRRNFFQPNNFFYFLFPFSIYKKQTFSALKKILPNLKGKILDIGCGSKPYENLCIKSSEYIGID